MKRLLPFLLASVALLACEKTVDIDVPFEGSKLVMHSYLNPDSTFKVHLTASRFILEEVYEHQPVSGAAVRVFEDGQDLGSMTELQNGWYELADSRPSAGKSYRIEARKAGLKEAVATERVLPVLPFHDLRIDTLMDPEYGNTEVEIRYIIEDQAGENYYIPEAHYTAHMRSVNPYDGSVVEHIYSASFMLNIDDPSLEQFCIGGCFTILTDGLFDGRRKEIRLRGSLPEFPEDQEIVEEKIRISLTQVSHAYYLYHASLQKNQDAQYDPFAEPTPVFSNVTGGYGILGSMSTYTELIYLE